MRALLPLSSSGLGDGAGSGYLKPAFKHGMYTPLTPGVLLTAPKIQTRYKVWSKGGAGGNGLD